MKNATDKATWTKAFDTAQQRVGQIEGLMTKASQTKDAKAIAEIQARIQAETALLQNQATMLALQKQISEVEELLLEQQETERLIKRSGGIRREPITFD